MRYCHLTRTIGNHSDAIVLSNIMQSLTKKILSLLRQDILSSKYEIRKQLERSYTVIPLANEMYSVFSSPC